MNRCKNHTSFLLCEKHKLQWVAIFTFIAFIGGFIQDVINPIKDLIKPTELKTVIYDSPDFLWEGYKLKISYPKYFGDSIELIADGEKSTDNNWIEDHLSLNVHPWGNIKINSYYLNDLDSKDKYYNQKYAIQVMSSIYKDRELNDINYKIIENIEGYDEDLNAYGWQYLDDAIYRYFPSYVESDDGSMRGVSYFTDSRYADRTFEIRLFNPDMKSIISISMPIENTELFREFHSKLRKLRDDRTNYSDEYYMQLYSEAEDDFIKVLGDKSQWDNEFESIVNDGLIIAKNLALIPN